MLFTNNLTYDLLGILIGIGVCTVAYLKWTFGYWKRKGLQQSDNTALPFGNAGPLLTKNMNFGELWMNHYKEFKAKGLLHGGAYILTQKFYVPTDLDIVKSIMQVDFQHFVNHGNYVNEEADPLTGHLFSLEDEKWRKLRIKLTPTFTSGKMKMMFPTMVDCTTGLKEILNEHNTNNIPLDIKDILGRFTTDIIGSCAFGIECNTMKNPDSDFRKYGKRIFQVTPIQIIRGLIQATLPHSFLKMINFTMIPADITEFFMSIVKNNVEYREKNNIYRKDFMHLLLQLKNMGKVTDDHTFTASDGKISEVSLNMNELTAQAFVFFVAGFETSSTTMTFALLELSRNQEIQQKVREEIETILAKHNNEITYDAVLEMTYLTQVINETLRLYPPLPVHTRKCNKQYNVPGTSVVLDEGDMVAISVMGIQRDPKYFPNPEVFDPERFNEKNKAGRHQYAWTPFGEGPRICIGLRFGLMQVKVGIICLLRDYIVTLNKKTKTPITFASEFILSTEGNVWLDIQKIKQ